jgi:putative oxidoreductase
MRLLHSASSAQLERGLTLLRIITGLVFVAHGAQKLFIFGLAGVVGGFGQMGIPLPELVGPAVAFVELFGGLALALGLFTRLAGVGLAVVMLGALLLVHAGAGFFLPNGYEFVLVLLATAATFAITGAGRYSLDAVLVDRRNGASRAVASLRRAA